MTIKNAYYPHQMPTQIVIETEDGFFRADQQPFREITASDLTPLAVFRPEMGDEIPGYTLWHYKLERMDANPVKALRRRLGLTQQTLADAAGVNIRQIQKMESGEILAENITLGTAIRLAKALGVEPADLIG